MRRLRGRNAITVRWFAELRTFYVPFFFNMSFLIKQILFCEIRTVKYLVGVGSMWKWYKVLSKKFQWMQICIGILIHPKNFPGFLSGFRFPVLDFCLVSGTKIQNRWICQIFWDILVRFFVRFLVFVGIWIGVFTLYFHSFLDRFTTKMHTRASNKFTYRFY